MREIRINCCVISLDSMMKKKKKERKAGVCAARGPLRTGVVLAGAYRRNPCEQKGFIPLNPNLQQTIQSPIKHKAGLRSLITPMSTHRGRYVHTHTHTNRKCAHILLIQLKIMFDNLSSQHSRCHQICLSPQVMISDKSVL